MNSKKMVKLSNTIGFVSVLALIYWIIIFITIEVFGLRVFKENTTSTFYFSILGILALMFGALTINVMFNLSRIAERDKNEDLPEKKSRKWIIFLVSIPAIICFLFFGNFISAKKMENHLKKSADEIIKTYSPELNRLTEYSFTKEWINDTANTIKMIEKIDVNFDNVYLILSDDINGNKMYLRFSGFYVGMDEKVKIDKIEYINNSTLDEREYFEKVFKEKYNKKHFISKGGNYKLFVPLEKNGNIIILVFSNWRNHGSLGS
jgi:NADH:ubiquinone oxidoreductase subunit 5 (subunit L)/multisubunit Na+/H+ antiporter MnhA subunit